jgi:AsmA protein
LSKRSTGIVILKVLRYGLYGLMALVLLAVAGTAIFVVTFDANRYKADIESLALNHTGRTLKIEGDIAVTFFPRLGAVINQASLSDPSSSANSTPNAASEPFLTLRSTRLSVALLPLLNGEVLVDGIEVQGLSIRLVRHAKGTLNIQDLIDRIRPRAAETNPSADRTRDLESQTSLTNKVLAAGKRPLLIDIQALNVSDSQFIFVDQQSQQRWDLTDIAVTTERLAPSANGQLMTSFRLQTASPAINTMVGFSARYQLALNEQRLTFSEAKGFTEGVWQGLKAMRFDLGFNAQADLKTGQYQIDTIKAQATAQINDNASPSKTVSLKADAPKMVLSNRAVSGQALRITGQTTQGSRRIETDIVLPKWRWHEQRLTLAELGLDLVFTDANLSQDPLHLVLSGPVELELEPETIKGTFSGGFNKSPLTLSVNIENFKQPVIGFDAHLEALDVKSMTNTLAPATKPEVNTQPTAATTKAAANTTTQPTNKTTPTRQFDFSVLHGHRASGQLRIDTLKTQKAQLTELQTQFTLNNGRLTLGPHQANVWDGKIKGTLVIDANTQSVSMTESVSDVDVADLLSSLSATPAFSGRGNLTANMSVNGTNSEAMLRSLTGQLGLELKDGAIKGVDLNAILQGARAALGRTASKSASTDGQTRFTELTATAVIENGMANNQDLSIKAPLFRVQGNGTIEIAAGQLNYLARVAVADTADGQGGADLKALRGITVPVRLMGPVNRPSYRVDISALAAELAKGKLNDDVTDKINRAVPGLGNALKGLFGR